VEFRPHADEMIATIEPIPSRTPVAGHAPQSYPNETATAVQQQRTRQVRAAQVRLLYSNANTGGAVTIITAPVLSYFQWDVIEHPVVAGWLLYILVLSAARFVLTRRYWRASPADADVARWGTAFAVGAALAGLGWGAAGILLYPEARLMNQVLLVFIVGGMMLGGVSVLAPRPESFLAFLLPTGLLPALRLLFDVDSAHVVMGSLTVLFTSATLATTWRIYRAIESSLHLRFENEVLVDDLQTAKRHTEALNQQLELRVQARTAELQESTERLRAEIKQREQMEEEVLRARKLESLGVLAGGIAHDFNNFLTVVLGNIGLARMELDPGAPFLETLDQTEIACQRAMRLSSQLLTFAKGGSPIRRVTSVAKLILDAVDLARAGSAVHISVDVADDLWCAEVDAGQIAQVFHNVLVNAKQAMADGGTMEVVAENVPAQGEKTLTPGAHVRISIRDYGSGISADILPLIFDPYFSTKGSGSGLGLTTAYAIVSKHGGRLSVESKSGEGTVFRIDLPASQSAAASEEAMGALPPSGTGRVLVMDDEENIRTLLSHVLSRLGYEVSTARDGVEAVDLYEAARGSGRGFDVVLLDLTVHCGMGGVETAARLKSLDPAAKLIASSGYSDASVMSRGREYGFDDVLPKPWAVSQVGELLRRVLAADPQPESK
jgi:signal transduction histidine kinase/ActR/RegA family two-component response regulator